jgi:hypothetical protein
MIVLIFKPYITALIPSTPQLTATESVDMLKFSIAFAILACRA